jgi:hypothetical protein
MFGVVCCPMHAAMADATLLSALLYGRGGEASGCRLLVVPACVK